MCVLLLVEVPCDMLVCTCHLSAAFDTIDQDNGCYVFLRNDNE